VLQSSVTSGENINSVYSNASQAILLVYMFPNAQT